MTTDQPNSFILTGPQTTVTYFTTGLSGEPSLTYEARTLRKTFTGQEIRSVSK